MCAGEKRRLFVPNYHGYNNSENPDNHNSVGNNMIFDVELVTIGQDLVETSTRSVITSNMSSFSISVTSTTLTTPTTILTTITTSTTTTVTTAEKAKKRRSVKLSTKLFGSRERSHMLKSSTKMRRLSTVASSDYNNDDDDNDVDDDDERSMTLVTGTWKPDKEAKNNDEQVDMNSYNISVDPNGMKIKYFYVPKKCSEQATDDDVVEVIYR